MSLVELSMAYGVATTAHAGRHRKSNEEFCVNHPIRMVHMVSTAGARGFSLR